MISALLESTPVPVTWLVGGLWAVTTGLAGFLGALLYRKVAEMTRAIEGLAHTVNTLVTGHARSEERLAAAERHTETRIHAVEARVSRLEHDGDKAA